MTSNRAYLVNILNKNYNDRMWFSWFEKPNTTDKYFNDAWIYEVDEADCGNLVNALNSLNYGLVYEHILRLDELTILQEKYPHLFV